MATKKKSTAKVADKEIEKVKPEVEVKDEAVETAEPIPEPEEKPVEEPKKETKAEKKAEKKTVSAYVWLKVPNPFGNKVTVGGLTLTCNKTLIEDVSVLGKLNSISAYLNVQTNA